MARPTIKLELVGKEHTVLRLFGSGEEFLLMLLNAYHNDPDFKEIVDMFNGYMAMEKLKDMELLRSKKAGNS